MANTKAGGGMQKIARVGDMGKSTLVTNPHVSIPMPPGAKPPAAPSGQGAGQKGQGNSSSSDQERKPNG